MQEKSPASQKNPRVCKEKARGTDLVITAHGIGRSGLDGQGKDKPLSPQARQELLEARTKEVETQLRDVGKTK